MPPTPVRLSSATADTPWPCWLARWRPPHRPSVRRNLLAAAALASPPGARSPAATTARTPQRGRHSGSSHHPRSIGLISTSGGVDGSWGRCADDGEDVSVDRPVVELLNARLRSSQDGYEVSAMKLSVIDAPNRAATNGGALGRHPPIQHRPVPETQADALTVGRRHGCNHLARGSRGPPATRARGVSACLPTVPQPS